MRANSNARSRSSQTLRLGFPTQRPTHQSRRALAAGFPPHPAKRTNFIHARSFGCVCVFVPLCLLSLSKLVETREKEGQKEKQTKQAMSSCANSTSRCFSVDVERADDVEN
eukprot:m.408103 g.408103  ORF g.408103 m.408103 type:complete len:111 (+) comp20142_c1_seq5:3576-3908(+)